ncbi:MAG: hypothetical protein ABSD41_01900 [Candidatus Bathyarchaeia archaeon]
MSSTRSMIHVVANWMAANARSFSYGLPDTLELALYLFLQHTLQVQQQVSWS